jgi:hypothetical protein
MAKKPIQKKVKKDKELNYNDYSINLSPNFVGDGYNTIGRNYSPAWGGQFQMGGNLPGSVGMMYARTNSPAPSNGPYAKKTKASAQNGKEMKFYQEGLDFRPKTISKKGSKIIKDPRGQWDHPGEITEIPSNEITMQGVNYPVLGVSNTGDTQMMYPNQDYVYEGDSVIEYPMMNMKTGGSIQDRGQLKKLDQLINFTNYNNMAKAKTGKKIKKAQMGMNALTGIGSSLLGAKGGTDNQQAGQIGNILGGLGSIFTGGSGNFGGMSGNQLGSQALDLFGGSGTAGKIMNVGPAGALGKGGAGFAKGLGAAGLGLVDSAGDIMKGFGEMKQQKQNIKKADFFSFTKNLKV